MVIAVLANFLARSCPSTRWRARPLQCHCKICKHVVQDGESDGDPSGFSADGMDASLIQLPRLEEGQWLLRGPRRSLVFFR